MALEQGLPPGHLLKRRICNVLYILAVFVMGFLGTFQEIGSSVAPLSLAKYARSWLIFPGMTRDEVSELIGHAESGDSVGPIDQTYHFDDYWRARTTIMYGPNLRVISIKRDLWRFKKQKINSF
jgi:hypothetical protein